jgi:hypothetical protein
MTPEQQLVDEFINHPMSAPYRKDLIMCLERNDAEGFSRIQDLIARESLGWTEEQIDQMHIVTALKSPDAWNRRGQ